MWWAATATNRTELPFVSIATEMWRGFKECGNALAAITENNNIDSDNQLNLDSNIGRHPNSVIARLKKVSDTMLELAPTLLTTVQRSMAMDVTPTNVSGGPRLVNCSCVLISFSYRHCNV